MTKLARFLALAAAALAVALIAPLSTTTAAHAATAPKFHTTTSSVADTGALAVDFDERGLGNTNVDYLLTANAVALFACINGGGNHPKAANKETIYATVSAVASLEPKNGRVQASITAGPPSAGGFDCPPGQRLVLANVTYTGIVLTDTTNGVSVGVADAARVFVDV